MVLLSITKFCWHDGRKRERFVTKGNNIVVANQESKRINIYFNIMKHAFLLLNLLSLCISTCINYSMTSCKQAYQAQWVFAKQMINVGSHQVFQHWNDGTMAPWCVRVLIVMHVSKFFQTHLNSQKMICVHNTGFHKLILPLVGCYYDLVPGRYRTIVWENAVKMIFTITSPENH